MRNNTLFLNNEPVKKKLHSPSTVNLFPDNHEKKNLDKIKRVPSDTHGEKGSQFMVFAAKVHNMAEIHRGYTKARKLHPLAYQIAAAYILPSDKGFQDDDEVSSGRKMLEVMKDTAVSNTVVYLVRFYSGKTGQMTL